MKLFSYTLGLMASAFSPTVAMTANLQPQQEQKDKHPNVILIVADDLGYGDLSCYGAHRLQTPGMDRIANEGIRFTQGFCTAATSTPSRYSVMTGKYPWSNVDAKILPGNAALIIDTQKITFPKLMKQAGYVTGSVGKWHIGLGDGNVDWNKEVSPGAAEIGYDYSFIQAATNDRVPCVFLENGKVVGLDPNDPLYVNYRKNFPGEPTGKNNPELLRMHPSVGHAGSIVNGVPRIGFQKGGKAAQWKDEEMAELFLNKAKQFVNINKENVHVPDGVGFEAGEAGKAYEELMAKTGQVEIQLLGLGCNGHIGFNEPGDEFTKMTNCVDLQESTIEANKRFFASADDVPKQAYTMGIGTIMRAKKVLLMVSGEDKAETLAKALCGPITPKVPASVLQLHNDVVVVADEAALSAMK